MADNMVETNNETKIWQDYQNGIAYQSSSKMSVDIPKFVNFYEGRQWAAPTERTKNLPRPVVNIIKLICRNKKSAILSTPVKIVYTAENDASEVEIFNHFAEYIQDEMGMEELDKKAIQDGVVKGSYIYHYYWDKDAKGKDGKINGGVRCEVIDCLNVFFANPCETDEQKQDWIIIATRETVSAVKSKADKDVDLDLIKSDDRENDGYGTIEQDGSELCTVLTRYFRKNGEVFCERATKSVNINKPFSITPNISKVKKELGFVEDEEDSTLESMDQAEKATLYPIVVGSYEQREKCIYGIGEVEGLIPNQKSINFMLAMSLLNVQELAWGKYICAPDALRGQVISNTPGQTLIDWSKTGNGIRKMTEQPIQSAPLTLVDTLTNLTRTVTGSSEVMTGEIIGSNMSGAAIAQLQAQAQQPIEELRDSFWQVKKRQGKILAQFFKLFYHNKSFAYKDKQNDDTMQLSTFEGDNYKNIEFDVVVEATGGTKSSAAGDINFLDLLLAKQAISLKMYIKAYPQDALSNRSELLRLVEEEEQNQLAVAKQTIEQLNQQLQQYAQVVQNQQETVNQVTELINENTRLKAFISNLYTESKNKITEGNVKINELLKDAEAFAKFIDDSGLVPPTKSNQQESTTVLLNKSHQ